MNDLSWLIYAADVVGGISSVFAVFGILCAISALGCVMFLLIEGDGPNIYSWEDAEAKRANYAARQSFAKKGAVRFPAALLVIMIAATFTPSSNTIYAIAASEMGEEVLQSATANKAMKALDAWLDRQIAPTDPAN